MERERTYLVSQSHLQWLWDTTVSLQAEVATMAAMARDGAEQTYAPERMSVALMGMAIWLERLDGSFNDVARAVDANGGKLCEIGTERDQGERRQSSLQVNGGRRVSLAEHLFDTAAGLDALGEVFSQAQEPGACALVRELATAMRTRMEETVDALCAAFGGEIEVDYISQDGSVITLRLRDGQGGGGMKLKYNQLDAKSVEVFSRIAAMNAAVEAVKDSGGGEAEIDRLFAKYCDMLAAPSSCHRPEGNVNSEWDALVRDWMDEALVSDESNREQATYLFNLFQTWARKKGYASELPSMRFWGGRVKKRFPNAKVGGKVWYFVTVCDVRGDG